MNPIHNPFSRDEHPDLTAAILGVVNETHSRKTLEGLSTTALRKLRKEYQKGVAKGHKDAARELADIHGILRSRGVGAALDEDAMTAERDAELRGKMKREKDYGEYRKLRAQREKEAKSKKLYGKGGKVDTSRKPDVSKSKQIWEAESPTEGKKPSNPFNPTLGDLLRSKQQDKKAPKGKPVKEAVTAAQQKVFARERERMLNALNNPKQKLSPTEREAVLARGARNAAAETRKGAVSPTGEKSPIYSAAKAHHEYARRESKKMDAIAKRKVQEGAQLDERIIDEVDFFQASKNLLTGKGFKTNREVSGARVNANMAAMQRRKARAAKTAKKTK